MSTKAKTIRLTFGARPAEPAPGIGNRPDAGYPPVPEAAAETAAPSSADPAESTGAEARRGAPSDTPGRTAPVAQPPGEIGGGDGPEPTRYGDWEVGGRCTDF